MSTATEVRALQERAARAQPAQHVAHLGDWWLRHAPGCGWWLSAVLPHGDLPNREELVRRVAEAEAFYARHHAVARWQITPGVCPNDLDTVLAERGYRRHSPVSLQVASTATVLQEVTTGDWETRVTDAPSPRWLGAWQKATRGDVAAVERMLRRVALPSRYVTVSDGDQVVAVGRTVVDSGSAGVFSMATLPTARGKGAGRTALAALAAWAADRGIDRMYLQVERDNPAALRLYERAGFRELCVYHYRSAS